MGKGSKRRQENFKAIQDRWPDNLGGNNDNYCCSCSIMLNKKMLIERPELYIFHDNGDIEHKNCNFN